MTNEIETPRTVGARVRWLRTKRGMTQMALSRAAGITQPTLSSLERGETKESFAATILGIAAALDANVTWLQTGRGDPFDTSDTNDGELEQVIADLSPKQRAMLLGIARTIKDSS